ncbi:15230_t:CDS:1 [Cetraspora pellucida]|uniref:15230_t:CDS:1 n=1 Tax=Cetraspora pellucida TaxID=1433469 RepID=A0ACA9LZW4_9GLOM|nr:15230_t:CDS:1 [Cetraspora pellucida]
MGRRKRRVNKKIEFCVNEKCYKPHDDQGDCDGTFVLTEAKKYHRVFGIWECSQCYKQWKSGYIWILLRKFNNSIPASELNEYDYYQQECKRCHSEINELIEWRPLGGISNSKRPHEEELCAKCQIGAKCQEADNSHQIFY